MGFGPDGYMYVTTGDGARVDDGHSQNLDSRLGKILRFNPRKTASDPDFTPPDNPFVGVAGDDLVWAYGLRNPWRASFDRANGDLWISDPGQSGWEEITRFAPRATGGGANLGWPLCEGSHVYPEPETGPGPCAEPGVVMPLIEYARTDTTCSVIGGYVYRGSASPALAGRYFYGDYCGGMIWSVPATMSPTDPIQMALDSDLLITSFGEDSLGELYVTGLKDGTLWRIVQD